MTTVLVQERDDQDSAAMSNVGGGDNIGGQDGQDLSPAPQEGRLKEYTDLNAFLRLIFPRLIEVAQPSSCMLLDHLREGRALSSEDEQEIRNKPTRRDRARSLWTFLNSVPPARFQHVCLPALREEYPHVLAGVTYRWPGPGNRPECVRHVIMQRMTSPGRFADVLVPTNGCTLGEYREITQSNRPEGERWNMVFELCARNSKDPAFRETMLKMCQGIQLQVPAEFIFFGQLSRGFPCSCLPALSQNSSLDDTAQRLRFLRLPGVSRTRSVSPSGNSSDVDDGNPSSTHTDSEDGRHSPSISSHSETREDATNENKDGRHSPSIDSVLETREGTANKNKNGRSSPSFSSQSQAREGTTNENEDEQQESIGTRKQQELIHEELKLINEAINSAAKVRPLSRKLAGLKEELKVLRRPLQSDAASVEQLYCNQGKIASLKIRANGVYNKLVKRFEFAEKSQQNIEEEKEGVFAELPFSPKKMLREKRKLLSNEINEGTPFYKKAKRLIEESGGEF